MEKIHSPTIKCKHIVKSFPGVEALRRVNFSIHAGRIQGLVGENGAGKSTLMKVLAGVYPPDSGNIYFDGESITFKKTDDAISKGIVTIHQDINLIPTLTVAENILLNNEPTYGKSGIIRNREMYRLASELLKKYQISTSPSSLVYNLPNDIKKMIQIIKAINLDARVLLMDEPTSFLTEAGIQLVHGLIKKMAEQGVGIVFISHYLDEIFAVCDQVSILRDGEMVADMSVHDTDMASVVDLMLGHQVIKNRKGETRRIAQGGETILSVHNLEMEGSISKVSFDLHRGEIIGFTGLTGSGLSELARALFGSENHTLTGGSIIINGKPVKIKSPADAIRHGIAMLTHDRLNEGILPDFSIADNICLPILNRYKKFFLLDRVAVDDTGAANIQKLNIKSSGPKSPVKQLSGGNQQKVLLAKWLETNPKVFIMDEPTIGIDVGSKSEIRKIIQTLVDAGMGIILITTEIEELENLCDRVMVMFRGSVVKEFAGGNIKRDFIMQASVGGRN